MKKSNLTRLTTNEAYLEECMNVLSLKTSATGFYTYNKKENLLPQYFVNVENDAYQTISIVGDKYRKAVRFDGINYVIDFRQSKKGDFVVINEELGVSYCCSSEELGENIHIKTVYRMAGDEQEYYKYLFFNGKIIVLEHKANNENGKIAIKNNAVEGFSREELIAYAKEYYSKCKEFDDAIDAELDNLGIDNVGKKNDENLDTVTEKRVNEIINTYTDGEFSKDDYNTISFVTDVHLEGEDAEFVSTLPEDVHDFNYSEYRKNGNCAMGYCYREDFCEEEDNEDTLVPGDENYDEGTLFSEDEEEETEIDKKLETIVAASIAGEEYSVTDSDDYTVNINEQEINDDNFKKDVLDDVATNTMDLQLEVDFYKENYAELSQEFEIIKNIISRRRKNMEMQTSTIEKKVDDVEH